MSSATLVRPADGDGASHMRHGHAARAVDPQIWLVIAGSIAGALSQLGFLPGIVRVALLLGFITTAPGAAIMLWWRGLSRPARATVVPLLGISVVVLVTASFAFAKEWSAGWMLAGLITASLVSAAAGLVLLWLRPPAAPAEPAASLVPVAPVIAASEAASGGTEADVTATIPAVGAASEVVDEDRRFELELEGRRARWSNGSSGRWAVPIVLGLAAIAWLVCLRSIGHAPVSAWGLFVTGGIGYDVAFGLVTLAGLIAFARKDYVGLLAAAAGLIVVERLTISIATSVPILPWTYKHIAVVDYIDRFHYVVRGTDIYHNWPGMFTASAWVDELTGVDIVTLAHWFTPVYHVGLVAAFYGAARAWGRTPLICAAAAFIFEACNFLIQDYFSPQALGYLLAIGVLAIMGEATRRRAASIPALVLFSAITISHQLTPYWLIIIAAGLVVLRRVRPWWLPVAFAAIAGGYLLLNYSLAKKYGVVSSTDPIQNIRLTVRATPVLGIRFQFYAIVFMYLVLFGSAGLALLIRLLRRHGREWRAPAVVALTPILLLAVQGYGGEAIFRVVLYALPGLSVVTAVLVFRAFARARWSMLIAAMLAVMTAVCSAQAFAGSYSPNRIDRSEIDVWRAYNRAAPLPSFFVSLSPGFPPNPEWFYVARNLSRSGYAFSIFNGDTRVITNYKSDADYEDFMDLLAGSLTPKDPPLYLALSDAQQVYGHLNGVLPNGITANLRRHISKDPRWTLVKNAGSSQLYLYHTS